MALAKTAEAPCPEQFRRYVSTQRGRGDLFFESCYRTSEQVGGIQCRISATEGGQGKSGEWFLLELLTELERAGMKIASGQCFGFKKPPSLGGEIDLSNIEVSPLYPYVSLMGQIHQQVNKLPPGTKITGVKIE